MDKSKKEVKFYSKIMSIFVGEHFGELINQLIMTVFQLFLVVKGDWDTCMHDQPISYH